jgi:hypothetical protein
VLQGILRYRSFLRGRASLLSAAERSKLERRLAPVDDSRGGRRYARFDVRWRALFLSPRFEQVVTVTNVGLGGLSFEPPLPLPDDGDVELLVSTDERECWRVYARPAWRRPDAMGLAFRDLPSASQ